MSVPVSEIHKAGGLAKWTRKQVSDGVIPHEVGLSREKMDKVGTDSGVTKKHAQNRNSAVSTEHDEQVSFIKWAEQCLQPSVFSLLFAIPNGGQRHKAVASNLRAEGVKAGVPDIMLAVARGGFYGLFVEMKRTSKSVISDAQYSMIQELREAGYRVEVCKGREEAKRIVREYLKAEDFR